MKAVRLLQIVIVLAAGAYLALLHDMNETNVALPFLMSFPPAVVILMALLLGWLLGWLPAMVRGMGRKRELSRLRRRVAELEEENLLLTGGDPEPPVIPDRRPAERQAEPESELENYDGHENL